MNYLFETNCTGYLFGLNILFWPVLGRYKSRGLDRCYTVYRLHWRNYCNTRNSKYRITITILFALFLYPLIGYYMVQITKNGSLNSQGAHKVGGLGEVWSIAEEQGRLDVWKWVQDLSFVLWSRYQFHCHRINTPKTLLKMCIYIRLMICNCSFNMNPFGDRLTFWSCVIGLFFSGLGLAMNQMTVQRFVALKSQRDARMWDIFEKLQLKMVYEFFY